MFPVENVLADIRKSLAAGRNVVLSAPPGSGKTTCVPLALLDEPWLQGKKILMLEPRRLAARNCARYISSKLGEPVGMRVGYQVRLERKISSATRLEIVTEGLLVQKLLGDPELSGIGLVVFDEFHERSLACDVSFALALETQRALREDLRMLVMSATLSTQEVASHLGNADVIRAQGRMYPVETKYLGDVPIASAVSRALSETVGDVLCFLPGEGEINRALESVGCIDGVDVMPLYGSLSKDEQDDVFRKSCRRKVILATSIAETSLTIEGVDAVVDSGLMRVPRFSPSTGMSGLITLPLSQDRSEQRRGRAGRISSGVCYRLWSEHEQSLRPLKADPEILDADLASTVLTSVAWGAIGREDLPWLTVPADSSWNRAVELLKMLGALDDHGRLTEKGGRMAQMPMHPRLANMLLGGGDPMLAAIIEDGSRSRETDIRYIPRTKRKQELSRRFAHYSGSGDSVCGSEGAMLALAYPDRIAKNRGNGSFRMVNGRGAFLDRDDPLSKEQYLVCCELDDRVGDAKVFLAAPISEREILSIFGDQIRERVSCSWDRRTDSVKSVLYGELGSMAIYEKARPGADGTEDALMEGIRQKGLENMPCWTESSLRLRSRVEFLRRKLPDAVPPWPETDGEALLAELKNFIGGMSRWRDLEKIDMHSVIDAILSTSGHDRRELDRLAPVAIAVANGCKAPVRYDGEEPVVEVKMQDCFGLVKTPAVVDGKVPVVMSLLSPARRPIQVTKDLAGFWKGAYQLVRKDMRGRYPKHYWPEDPLKPREN